MKTKFENLNTTERFVRFLISFAAIVIMMESTIAGSTLFAVGCLIAIALATTAIVAWDPLKSVTWNLSREGKVPTFGNTQKHA